ncbi:hypothetical protein NLB33_07715 [Mycolicibacterium smegmatis]|uniref:hypothetical protein n=1 Tax=Mycolicibacterium smegmatis TaxID=1772 RepID=UPI0020A4063E|nr:hypothetical protein [Mycolicibacterium smegmatis]MCP2622748.1 hypothetical protein [Mycolicibacterium smegmatis]
MILIVVCVGITAIVVWMNGRQSEQAATRSKDCEVVGDLATKWNDLATASLTGDTKSEDWFLLRDQASDGANAVSTADIREQLGEWEKGFGNLAELQRGLENPQPGPSRIETQRKVAEAGTQVYATAQMLRGQCPDNWPQGNVSPTDEWTN